MRLVRSSSRLSDRATSITLALALALGSTAMVLAAGVRAAPAAVTLVSVNTSGTDGGNEASRDATMSADGTKVVFQSNAGDLGPDDAGAESDIYVRDLTTGTTDLVSVNMADTDGGDADSYAPRITPDGSKVVFESDASDLISDDAGNDRDILVRDLVAETTTLVSANAAGTDGGSGSVRQPVSDRGWNNGDLHELRQ